MNFPDLPYLIDLQQALWQWPRSRASLMVGAGMSFNAEPLAGVTSNFPTWSQLVRAMFDEVYPPQPDENPQQREQWFSGLNALTLASEYEATFGRQKLERLIKSQVPDMEHLPGKLHKLLLQLPWVDVFTTNYDTLLERTEIYEKAYQPVIKASELTSATSPRVVKLHGSFPSQTPFIITEEDYRCYPRDFAPFINTVRQSLLENILVLIGFSGEDPNFLKWVGWIRDELGIRHNPIYLVGPLNLSPAKRSLLAKRGVTPIDLSPVFASINTPIGIHATSLEWFLLSLLNMKPLASETWPKFEKNNTSELTYIPPLIEIETKYPKNIELSSQNPFGADETEVLDVIARWRFEREKYPKWLIAPEGKRNGIWTYTNQWSSKLLSSTKTWNITDRLVIAYEINWRLELSLCPLFTDFIEPIDEIINHSLNLETHKFLSKTEKFSTYNNNELIEAWFSLIFALLREAREMYNKNRWEYLSGKIKSQLKAYPKYEDRHHYECALWHIWNIERSDAKNILLQWQPSLHNPLANMWKAGLLAELDETYNATDILRLTLTEIRRSLLTHGQSIELLSLEGWCTYLIARIEPVNRDFSTHYRIRNEFLERWQELKRWDCDPRVYENHFDKILSTQPPELPTSDEVKKRGFDPWNVSTSLHFNNDIVSAFFPGFGYIRLHELVGMPMRLTGFSFGDTLEKACIWIMPFISFWSPALLIRSGNKKFLEKGKLLSRIEVVKLQAELALRLYDWCLSAFERELASIKGELQRQSSEHEFLDVIAEILSRLAFKVDQDRLNKSFPIYKNFYSNTYIRKHHFILDKYPQWMRRLFDAATTRTITSWLPNIIDDNLLDGLHHFYNDRFPEPTSYLPTDRLKVHNHSDNFIRESIDNLIKRAEKESYKNWELAIYRLLKLKNCELLSKNQIKQLSKLMWKNCIDNELPKLHVWMSTYINMPHPKGKKPDDIIKKILLANPLENIATINEDGKLSMSYSNRRNFLMAEAIYVTKPLVLAMMDHRKDGIDWTPEETKLLLQKLYDWWKCNKIAFDQDHSSSFGNPVRERLKSAEKFLYIVILPRMDLAEKCDWEKLINWLDEIRNLGVFISSVYPYTLLHHPSEEVISKMLSDDLMLSNNEEAIEASARAIRHWTHLTQINDSISKNINHLISFLIERVIFRHQMGLLTCLKELSCLIVELPNIFNKQQFYLMVASLPAWHYATILNGTSEFPDEDKPDLRSMVASFAGALFIWHQKQQPNESLPQPIEQWQKMSEIETLPEVKHAFDIWKTL